jgi:EpsI family protein
MTAATKRAVIILTVLLLLQAAVFYGSTRREYIPLVRPLSELPIEFGSWKLAQEGVIEPEVRDILKADDLLTRSYVNVQSRANGNLFVAFFKSQRTGQAPHSPKNCLPGSGWVPAVEDRVTLTVPGDSAPKTVNRYIVQKGDNKSVVIYWYQSRDRVVASEYWAKIYVVADALRYNRTDTALVRVVAPIIGDDADAATRSAVDFIQHFFPTLSGFLPA